MTAAISRHAETRAPRSVRAARPSGKTPYVLTVLPLPPDYEPLTLFRPAVCVIIGDPAATTAPSSQRLQDAFGLTDAEARLVVLLLSGDDLRDAAAQLEITYGTARARLADIFQKTGTRPQAELLRVILSSVPL
jgi:DNA-binding CsgD family transcriptional regulator